MVERRAFPIFNGKQETWSEFTRTFKELIKASQLGPVLELGMLKAKIPEEASRMLIGITDPAEVWER